MALKLIIMSRKQWVFFSIMLIFIVLFVFNFLEYQKAEKAIGALLGMLSAIIFIIAMAILMYYSRRKS